MTNIILCGGSGTRLWPISRTLMPKQFVKLFGERSLFQLTVERNSGVCDRRFIVSNQDQYFLAVDQLEEIAQKEADYLLEPIGRNTAPAIALACMTLDPEEIVLVTPSDHLIKDQEAYQKAIQRAKELAAKEYLVTFGIRPDYPETGYGYIEADGENVTSFKEKPDQKTAQSYIQKGNYYWNSGMFCFKAGIFLRELEKHSPKIYQTCKEALASTPETGNSFLTGTEVSTSAEKPSHNKLRAPTTPTPGTEVSTSDGTGTSVPDRYPMSHNKLRAPIRIKPHAMRQIPSDSIDYAVMEKSDIVKVIPSDIGWSDLGSFDALYEELPKDQNGNTQNDHHIAIDSHNNLVMTYGKQIATIDIDDLIIIDTADALLITKKGSSQKVKQVVEKLNAQKSDLTNTHTIVYRPWGTYEVLLSHNGYKIKRIVVKPGKRLSLQKHFHRNEHWIVVSGTATVTVGDEVRLIRPNESTYIKMGEIHRLENQGKIPVVLIEAQVGEYTGEDDIVRIDDDFKRNEL